MNQNGLKRIQERKENENWRENTLCAPAHRSTSHGEWHGVKNGRLSNLYRITGYAAHVDSSQTITFLLVISPIEV